MINTIPMVGDMHRTRDHPTKQSLLYMGLHCLRRGNSHFSTYKTHHTSVDRGSAVHGCWLGRVGVRHISKYPARPRLLNGDTPRRRDPVQTTDALCDTTDASRDSLAGVAPAGLLAADCCP
jgi:hypothetical protein